MAVTRLSRRRVARLLAFLGGSSRRDGQGIAVYSAGDAYSWLTGLQLHAEPARSRPAGPPHRLRPSHQVRPGHAGRHDRPAVTARRRRPLALLVVSVVAPHGRGSGGPTRGRDLTLSTKSRRATVPRTPRPHAPSLRMAVNCATPALAANMVLQEFAGYSCACADACGTADASVACTSADGGSVCQRRVLLFSSRQRPRGGRRTRTRRRPPHGLRRGRHWRARAPSRDMVTRSAVLTINRRPPRLRLRILVAAA